MKSYSLITDTRAKVVDHEKDHISPIELTIRTRWPGASVNWNGSDPLF